MAFIKSSAGRGKYQWNYDEFCYLVQSITKTKDFKETLHLFLDLHTKQEIAEIIRRLIIASMLVEGKTYEEICETVNTSPSTISKVWQKMSRQKSMLQIIIARSGSYSDFYTKRRKIEQKDQLSRLIDGVLKKHSLGLFGK